MPTDRPIRVFISGTRADLSEHFTRVRNVIAQRGMHLLSREEANAASSASKNRIKDTIRTADVFIGVYTYRSGTSPSYKQVLQPELEYEYALERGMERIVFVPDTAAENSKPHADQRPAEHDPGLTSFYERIARDATRKTFTTPEDLALKVSQALDEWERRARRPDAVHPPREYVPVTLLLLIVTVLVVADVIFKLFRMGQATFGFAALLLGAITSIVPLFEKPFRRLQASAAQRALPSWLPTIGIQIAILLALVVVRTPLLATLADQQIAQAVQADSAFEAQSLLDAVVSAGADVELRLREALDTALAQPPGESGDAHAIQLATLVRRYSNSDLEPLFDSLATSTREAVQARQPETALRNARALAALDPTSAARLAEDFNGDGIRAYVSDDVVLAKTYLQVVKSIDDVIERERDSAAKSIARYNLGVVMEADSSLSDRLQLAAQAYREALGLDASNLSARYQLSSLLLTHFSDDRSLLQEAVSVAEQGLLSQFERGSSPFCQGPQDSSDPGVVDRSWHCFLLLTTEAGARLALEDIPRNIAPLLERAIRLAEDNAQFGDRYFTAEAYYYQALLEGEAVTDETLCRIMGDYNRDIPRHVIWADYAHRILEARHARCDP